jgi:DNA-binding transcriptional ArsR family regulator
MHIPGSRAGAFRVVEESFIEPVLACVEAKWRIVCIFRCLNMAIHSHMSCTPHLDQHGESMPFRSIASRELADVLAVLAHPCRLRIVEEIGAGELDVAALAKLLGISHSGTSQHLAHLRAHKLVTERREGRRVIYRLVNTTLASWLLVGLSLLEAGAETSRETKISLRRARAAWSKS